MCSKVLQTLLLLLYFRFDASVQIISSIMYWTTFSRNGSVYRSAMDGSNASAIVTGQKYPSGITIDFQNSRLYWACHGDDKIQSSNMQGADFKTVVKLHRGADPRGIGLLAGRIYWTGTNKRTLESSTMTGQDFQILHNGTAYFSHLAVVPRLDLPSRTRLNHCENQCGDKVCVLKTTSFKCLSWVTQKLAPFF